MELYNKDVCQDKPIGGIGIPKQDFTDMNGTATETAIKTLSHLKDKSLISTDHGRSVIILNEKGLRAVADF